MITDVQRQQLETLERAKIMCQQAGIVAKVAAYGVLLLVLPSYGDETAEQLLLQATEPSSGEGGNEGR